MITVIHYVKTDKHDQKYLDHTEMFTGKIGRKTALERFEYYKKTAHTIDGCDLHMTIYEPIRYPNGELYSTCGSDSGVLFETFSTRKNEVID